MGFSLVDFQPVFCLYSFIFSDEVLAYLTSGSSAFYISFLFSLSGWEVWEELPVKAPLLQT